MERFAFTTGAIMDFTQSWFELGTLNARKDNAVLCLHQTSTDGSQFLTSDTATNLFGPGCPLDTARYFVVIPDAIGHGASSKPSDGMRADFPRYGYRDMLETQRRLVADVLGIEKLRLVLGTSMGAMHTWMWSTQHPKMADAFLPIAGVPSRLCGRNLLWRRLAANAIRSDPDYLDGRYETQPVGLKRAMEFATLMVSGAPRLSTTVRSVAEADAFRSRLDREIDEKRDATDLLYAVEASFDYDPEPLLGDIDARLLAVCFEDDDLNPATLGEMDRLIARVPGGEMIRLPMSAASNGHLTFLSSATWADCVRRVMGAAPPGSGEAA